MLRIRFLLSFFLIGVVVLLTGSKAGHAQSGPRYLTGVFENYLQAAHSADGTQVSHPIRYLSMHGRITPAIRFVAGELNYDGKDMLDENYVSVDRGSMEWRIGRFRSAFGHSDWSENYYTGFIPVPLLRTVALGPQLELSRLDTGADWQDGTGSLQFQVGVVDIHARPYQPLPARPDYMVGRVQTYAGNAMLGFNLLSGGSGEGRTDVADLDWRWSTPHVQVRGEFLFGNTGRQHPHGYYLDFFYHPPSLTRTTFLARSEGVTASHAASYGGDIEYEKQFADRYTLGVKQVLSSQFTLELNRSWGNATELVEDKPGYEVQLITSTHF